MLQPVRRAAYRALLGPIRQVTDGELRRGCLAFYRAIFQGQDGVTAFKAMNSPVDDTKETFDIVTAERAFRMVYRHFFEEKCSDELLRERETRALRTMHAMNADRGIVASPEQVGHFTAAFRARMRDHRSHFEALLREFFYIDQFPENDQRFDVRFEDCAAGTVAAERDVV